MKSELGKRIGTMLFMLNNDELTREEENTLINAIVLIIRKFNEVNGTDLALMYDAHYFDDSEEFYFIEYAKYKETFWNIYK